MKSQTLTSTHQLQAPSIEITPLSDLTNREKDRELHAKSTRNKRLTYEMAVVFGMNTAIQQAAIKQLLAEKNIRVLYVGDPAKGSTADLVMTELDGKLSRYAPTIFVGHGNAEGLNNIFGYPTGIGEQVDAVAPLRTNKGGKYCGHIHQFACFSANARGKRNDAASRLEATERTELNLKKGQRLFIHGNTVHATSADQINAAIGAVAEQVIAHRDAKLDAPTSTEVLLHIFHVTGQTISLSQSGKPTVILSPPKSVVAPDGGFADMVQRLALHPAFSGEAKKAELERVLKKEISDREVAIQFPVKVLFTNVKRGNLQQVQRQIKSDAAYLCTKTVGITPLIAAVAEDQLQLVRALMASAGNMLDAYLGDEGGTALMMAVSVNSLAMTKLLLEGPAALPSYANAAGETALMLAAMQGCEDIVELLLKHMQPETIAMLDREGNSALSLARDAMHEKVAQAIELAMRKADDV